MRGFWIHALLLGLLAGSGFSAAAGETGIRDGRFVVPRIAWGRPLAGGPLKTLVIAPINGARNAWDLAETLDLDLTVFSVRNAEGNFGGRAIFGTASFRHWGLYYDRQLAEARELFADGKRYDLIVLANVAMNSLPPEIAYRLSEQVTGGAGLVMTNASINNDMLQSLYTRHPVGQDALDLLRPWPFEALESGVRWKSEQTPIEPLTAVKPYDLRGKFEAYQAGKGRFITLPFPFEGTNWGAYASVPALIPGIPVNMANRWQEDYHYGMVAKACLWAAGREPAVTIADVSPQGGELAIGERPRITVSLRGQAGFRGRVEYELRDGITNQALEAAGRNVTTEGAEMAVTFDAEAMPVAKTFVIVRLRDEAGEVIDFGGGHLRVRQPATLTVTLDEETVDSPAPVTGRIELPAELAGATVELSLFDSRARIWEKTAITAGPGATRFSVPTARTPLVVNGLRVVATVDGRPAAASDAFFTVRQPRDPYYVTVSDESWPTWHSIRRLERMYEWGADGFRDHKSGGGSVRGQYDANPVSSAIVHAIAGLDHNPGRPHIWASMPFNGGHAANLIETGQRNSRLYRHYNQAMYNTTDDAGPNLTRFASGSLPMFLDYLRDLYGDIAALNTEWETDYADYADIPEAFVAESRAAGRAAVWSDYMRFAGEAYVKLQLQYRDAIQAVDPRAAAGTDAVYYGTSVARLYRELGYIMPYYRPWLVHFARSMAKAEPPVYTGVCTGVYGYYGVPESLRRRTPWNILLTGNNSILYWSLLAGFEGDLSFGGTLVGWMMDEISRIKLSGAAQWIIEADRAPATAAILYSEDSRRAEPFNDSGFSNVEPAGTSFQEMLDDQGIPFNYLSRECVVEDDTLADPNLKLLVLPAAIAISEAEAEAIRAFVQRGGTVWADIEPAVMTRHGRRLPQGQLDDLFGITRTGPAQRQDVEVTFPGHPALTAGADASVRAAGGRALLDAGGVPLFIRQRHGAGAALLWNLDPAFYGVGRGAGSDAEQGTLGRSHGRAAAGYAFIGERLAEAGLRPRQTTLAGGPPIGLALTEFTRGDGRILAMEVKPVGGVDYPATVRMPLDGRFHVHEIRSGRQWPISDVIELDVEANDVFLFSLLPAAPASLHLRAPSEVTLGTAIEIEAICPTGPRHTLMAFSLIDPEGTVRRDYMRRVSTDNGRTRTVVALPWNTHPGQWTLEAKNLLTGGAAQQTIEVKGN